MNKEIKSVEFNFEDCSGVIVPSECFYKLEMATLKEIDEDTNRINNIITDLHCEIEINNKTTWSRTWEDNEQSAIQKLIESDNITYITILCEDDSSIEYAVRWFGYDNPWIWENDNRWQHNHIGNGLEIDIKQE